eukprot:2552917-Prymnesium_polylepis.1
MVALVGRAWAASPPDVTSIVTQSNSPLPNNNATLGSLARSASAKQAADGPCGASRSHRTVSDNFIRNTLRELRAYC